MTDEPIHEQPAERPPVDTVVLLKSQLPAVLVELILVGVMLGVYLFLNRFSREVWLGAALGTALTLLNHGAMILSLLRAEKAESPAKGQLQVRGMYILRMLVLLGIYVAAFKLWDVDVLASLLPLCFLRIAIFISELFRRKKGGA